MNIEEQEIWKGVVYQGKDYSDRVEISNIGRIRNTQTKRIYKTFINNNGYRQVNISLGSRNSKKVFRIHRCVAETFIPNPDNLPIPNHKDGDKLNNHVNNLEWDTCSGNILHAYSNGLVDVKKRSGLNNPQTKLSDNAVEYIRKNYKAKDKEFGARALARKFGVSHASIVRTVNYQSHKT